MTILCKFKDSLGKPRKGSHSLRIPILDVAAVDLILTILVAWGISYYFDYSFWYIFLAFFVLGFIMHKLFCVDTKFTKFIDSIFK